MKISLKELILYILVAVLCAFVWFKFAYPQIAFVDLSVDKTQAQKVANDYLVSKGIDTSKYQRVIVLENDYWVDRFLQKTIGFQKEEEFINEHDYDLFYWSVRFFIENQKQEYVVSISSKSGKVILFQHLIEDIEKRITPEKEIAKRKAKDFLKKTFALDFSEYELHEEQTKKFENRTDFIFHWERKDVAIPWKETEDEGVAKLLVGAIVSGDEIRSFYKGQLDIPEKFKRYIHRHSSYGDLLARIAFLWLFFWAIWSSANIITRKNDILIKKSWRLFLFLGISLFTFQIIYALNNFNTIIFGYPTSSSLASFLGNTFIFIIINAIFINLLIVLLGVSSEPLHYETYPKKKASSFILYINSTIFSRPVAKSILFGYLIFVISLGMQSILFYFGQRFLGVWIDKMRVTTLSSSYLPFLSIFIIGFQASFREEIIYRMFAINWFKKYGKSSILAIIVSALIWGFGHSQYPVFPIWFRGIEVSLLGIFWGFIFLRFGIIPLIVAHYLFDVHWGSSAYIFGHASLQLFISAVVILLLPLAIALIAFIKNKPDTERQMESTLDAHQKYNFQVLSSFLFQKKKEGVSIQMLKEELISHGWDRIIVELAINKIGDN